VRAGELSARELLEAHLAAIAAHDGTIRAVVALDEAAARRAADRRDAELARARERGVAVGPLHGVPVLVKDLYEVAELPTTFGHPRWRHFVGEVDATPVARLRAAGAVIVGKTNVPFAGFDWQTWNSMHGRTTNPWDAERTCGGSSGGAAAALAAGFTPLELGSDMAGSIRVPAHFCGVAGLKPTEFLVSGAGHADRLYGRGPTTVRHLVHCGPMARTVADLRLALDLVAGPDGRDPGVRPYARSAARSDRPLRIAFAARLPGLVASEETREVVAGLARDLAAAGHEVLETAPGEFDPPAAVGTWGEICGVEIGAALPWPLRALRLGLRFAPPLLFGRGDFSRGIGRGLAAGPRRYFAALTARDRQVLALDRFLATVDAFLCPVAAVPAFTHRRTGSPIEVDGVPVAYAEAAGAHALVFNVTGHPAVAIPAGRSREGLPIGVQLVGRRGRDLALLDVAERVEAVTGGFRAPRL